MDICYFIPDNFRRNWFNYHVIFNAFLPGDALIFSIGMIAASDDQNHLHIEYIIPLLMVAAILGDNVNYYVGRKFGVGF